MNELELGDRHSRSVLGLGTTAEPKVVMIRAGSLKGSVPRQHLLVCLVNLLVRLHGSVKSVLLDVEGEISVPLPNAAPPNDAFDAMAEMAQWANGGRIPVMASAGAADVIIDISADPVSTADLYAWGSGWKSWVGRSPATFSRVLKKALAAGF